MMQVKDRVEFNGRTATVITLPIPNSKSESAVILTADGRGIQVPAGELTVIKDEKERPAA